VLVYVYVLAFFLFLVKNSTVLAYTFVLASLKRGNYLDSVLVLILDYSQNLKRSSWYVSRALSFVKKHGAEHVFCAGDRVTHAYTVNKG
jgi:hypothetical protein